MRLGACDFVAKPIEYDLLDRSLQIAGRTRTLRQENLRLRSIVNSGTVIDDLVGQSPTMNVLKRTLERVAPTDETCLVMGENGTGKEVVARILHQLSPRASAPFVAVNCGALTESLIESEPFGHAWRARLVALTIRVFGLFFGRPGGRYPVIG